MNRHQRRQQKLGRAPTVVAMPTLGKRYRVRRVTESLKAACNLVTIDSGNPTDSKFVVGLMQRHFEKTGNPPIVIDPAAPMLIARHKVTNEPLGMVSLKPIPPGKIYVENFLVVDGRAGRMAARALCERVMQIPPNKVCVVEAGNVTMLRILEHYGGRVVGFVVEGPFSSGAPQVTAAAEPLEQIG